MTQCHGGGFHELGLAREMVPPRAWFNTSPPAWAVGNSSALRLPVAGFTATDEASPAAGCDPDPDPDLWAGYERFLPESLFGLDLMSGESKGRAAQSFAEAHDAATRVDRTIDKPRATSEHFLEAWARLIETRLTSATGLSPAVERAVARYRRVVDGEAVRSSDPRLQRRQAQFVAFTRELVTALPAAGELLSAGTREQLDAATKAREERGPGRGGRRGGMADVRRSWNETLRPGWKSAVLAGRVPGLKPIEREFEQRLLQLEDEKIELMFGRGAEDALLNELYWASGYAEVKGLNRRKAEEMARWAAERRSRIVAWAKTSTAPDVRAAAERIGPGPKLVEEAPRPLARKTAAERVLFYRRVLAAWEFLLTVEATSALEELRTLIAIEELPVRG
jgi:hypothetical protein